MNWHLYKRDCPNTYPSFDYPLNVYKKYSEETFYLDVCYYDKKMNKFFKKESRNSRWYMHYDSCYYAYINKLPGGKVNE